MCGSCYRSHSDVLRCSICSLWQVSPSTRRELLINQDYTSSLPLSRASCGRVGLRHRVEGAGMQVKPVSDVGDRVVRSYNAFTTTSVASSWNSPRQWLEADSSS